MIPTQVGVPAPDPARQEKIIENLRDLVATYHTIAEGPRPGLAAYAAKRIPELEAALVRHEAR